MSERRASDKHDPRDQHDREDQPASADASRATHQANLAYIGTDGQIYVHSSDKIRQLTWSWHSQQNSQSLHHLAPPQGPPGQTAQQSEQRAWTYSWPAWSPVGEQLACFAWHGEGGPASVYTVSADGVESWERAGLGQGAPIYGNWSPQADIFTVLVQRGNRQLSLEAIVMAQPGKTTPLLAGAPLFWSWAPHGNLVATHVGHNTTTGHVLLIDPSTGKSVQEISTTPGSFRVPAWSPDGDLLTYVERDSEGIQTLRLFDIQSGKSAPISRTSGITAALWSPDGRALAFGSTQRQGSLLFPSLHVLDLSTGQTAMLLETPVTGFLWSPLGNNLLYLSVDTQHSRLRWHKYDRETGESLELVRFLPSREQTLQFSFFDQYAASHPLLDPDGAMLTFTGHLFESDRTSPNTSPMVYALPLTPPFTPHAIAPGTFACWNIAARS